MKKKKQKKNKQKNKATLPYLLPIELQTLDM